jgi:CBS domain-containing protein
MRAGAEKVGDVMHRGAVTCRDDAPAIVAARVMAAHRIHCVLLTNHEGNCVSVVSDADLAAGAERGLLDAATAREIGRPPVFVEREASARDALALMHRHATTHLVVAAPGSSRPLGVVSVLDVVD